MKKQVLLRWFWALLEYLMVFPLILILAGIILPYDAAVVFTVTLSVHLFFGLILTFGLKKFRNLVAALITIAYVFIVTLVFRYTLLTGNIEEIIITIAGTVSFFIWGVRLGTGARHRSIFLYSGGLIINIISLFVINRVPVLKPYFTVAMWAAITYCILGLPLANRRFLIGETHEKSSLSKIPNTVLRGNKVIVFILLSAIIIMSFWRVLLDAFLYIADSIAWVIGKIVEFLGSLYQNSEGGGSGGNGDMGLPPAEEANPVVSTILDILALLFVAAVAFFIIRYFVKNYKRIFKALYNMLSSFFNRFQKWSSTEQGYFDREESLLRTEMPKRPSILKRIFKRGPKWRDMKDNVSRIRFIYTKFVIDHIRKGFRFRLADTPSETVEHVHEYDKEKDHTKLKDVYNSVRYGGKSVDDQTVSSLKNEYL